MAWPLFLVIGGGPGLLWGAQLGSLMLGLLL